MKVPKCQHQQQQQVLPGGDWEQHLAWMWEPGAAVWNADYFTNLWVSFLLLQNRFNALKEHALLSQSFCVSGAQAQLSCVFCPGSHKPAVEGPAGLHSPLENQQGKAPADRWQNSQWLASSVPHRRESL